MGKAYGVETPAGAFGQAAGHERVTVAVLEFLKDTRVGATVTARSERRRDWAVNEDMAGRVRRAIHLSFVLAFVSFHSFVSLTGGTWRKGDRGALL